MKTLTHKELDTMLIDQPLKLSYDKKNDDAVVSIHKNNPDSESWVALPVEEQISSEQMSKLESYCASNNIDNFFAFSSRFIEKGGIFTANTTAVNFKNIEGKFALRAYTIIPEDKSFQIISDGDYYTIFVGTDVFLSAVLGLKMEEGMKQFKAYIKIYHSNTLVKRRLSKVFDACDKFNSRIYG